MTDTIFRVGDKLDSAEGECVVEGIEDGKSLPIRLRFYDRRYRYVTADGKSCLGTGHPCVWFRETGKPPAVGERPPFTPDKPIWCRVWYDDPDDYRILLIVRKGSDYYMDVHAHFWSNAEPCSKDEIPDWWPEEWT